MPSNKDRFVVIIAGGKGERFWPQSRARRPKHLLPIVGKEPMLAQTLARIAAVVPATNTFVITSAIQAPAVREVCKSLPKANVIAEPMGRDTAAAVGLAAELVAKRNPQGVFAILPADAVIHDKRSFQRDLRNAFSVAKSAPVMVTIGIKPTEPATGFGYIQQGDLWETDDKIRVFKARRFVEKPTLDVAKQYLKSGDYVWNAGMFIWSVSVVREAFARHEPELGAELLKIGAQLRKGRAIDGVLKKIYPTLKKISVDYALLEKSDNVVVIPSSFDWDDVGAWPAVARHYPKDDAGNVVRGAAVIEGGKDNIIYADGGHVTALLGVDNLIVVHTADATLICPKDRAQDIKLLIKRLDSDAKLKALL